MPILTWLTREEDVDATKRVDYRLFEEVHELSIGDGKFGNMLIQGNNLDALMALLPFYAGRVKCVYIDPPYNTRLGLRALRRQSRTHPLARHDVAPAGTATRASRRGWLHMGFRSTTTRATTSKS